MATAIARSVLRTTLRGGGPRAPASKRTFSSSAHHDDACILSLSLSLDLSMDIVAHRHFYVNDLIQLLILSLWILKSLLTRRTMTLGGFDFLRWICDCVFAMNEMLMRSDCLSRSILQMWRTSITIHGIIDSRINKDQMLIYFYESASAPVMRGN